MSPVPPPPTHVSFSPFVPAPVSMPAAPAKLPFPVRIAVPPLQVLTKPIVVAGAIGAPPVTPAAKAKIMAIVRPRIRTFVISGGDSWGGLDIPNIPAGETLQGLADGGLLNDATILHMLQGQAVSLMVQDQSLYSKVEDIWNTIEQGAIEGAKEGAAIGTSIAVMAAIAAQLGFTFLADLLTELVTEIAAAITEALMALGISTFTASVAAGGSFGYVGAIVGAVIGAAIALGEFLYGGQHLTITDGRSYSCKDYVSTNLKNASDWLVANPEKIVGLTAARFAEQTALFLANPTWLAKNQRLTGLSQPNPPDPGTGDALDMVYTQVPGAYELLNREQFIAAIALTGTTPQKLSTYAAIVNPFPGQGKFYKDPSGTPYGNAGVRGQGVYPDPRQEQYASIFSTATLTWTPGEAGPTNGNMIPGTQVPSTWAARYAAPPNLVTNKNTYAGSWPDGQGKISGQTDQARGIYFLQVMFPTLSASQCEAIFDKLATAYGGLNLGSGGVDLMGNVDGSTGSVSAAPLPPHPAPPPPPQGVFPPGTHMTSFGPTVAGLQGLDLGSFGSGLGFLSAINVYNANPTAQNLANLQTAGAKVAAAAPITPPEAIATIAGAAKGDPTSKGVINSTLASATNHPVAAFNAKVLDAAHRLTLQASYAAKYLGADAARSILAGNLIALPRGTGKYDKNLPLVLEKTVDAILYDPSATTADLRTLAEALLQLPA